MPQVDYALESLAQLQEDEKPEVEPVNEADHVTTYEDVACKSEYTQTAASMVIHDESFRQQPTMSQEGEELLLSKYVVVDSLLDMSLECDEDIYIPLEKTAIELISDLSYNAIKDISADGKVKEDETNDESLQDECVVKPDSPTTTIAAATIQSIAETKNMNHVEISSSAEWPLPELSQIVVVSETDRKASVIVVPDTDLSDIESEKEAQPPFDIIFQAKGAGKMGMTVWTIQDDFCVPGMMLSINADQTVTLSSGVTC